MGCVFFPYTPFIHPEYTRWAVMFLSPCPTLWGPLTTLSSDRPFKNPVVYPPDQG